MFETHALVDAATVVQALSSPAGVFIEDGCAPIGQRLKLALAVCTHTAFRLPLAEIVTDQLRTRLKLQPAAADAVQLSLQEVLANAIIHGNLGIGSEQRGSSEAYSYFCNLLDERLQDPVAAGRTIQLSVNWTKTRLSLAVTDQGAGFSASMRPTSTDMAHGRGLGIVRGLALDVSWNQRCRRMAFAFNLDSKTSA